MFSIDAQWSPPNIHGTGLCIRGDMESGVTMAYIARRTCDFSVTLILNRDVDFIFQQLEIKNQFEKLLDAKKFVEDYLNMSFLDSDKLLKDDEPKLDGQTFAGIVVGLEVAAHIEDLLEKIKRLKIAYDTSCKEVDRTAIIYNSEHKTFQKKGHRAYIKRVQKYRRNR